MKTLTRIVSVLQLISGILVVILGLMTGGLLAMLNAGGLAVLSIAVFVLSSLFDILCGVFGLRAAADPAKSMPAVVLGILSVVFAVWGLAMDFSAQNGLACIIPVVYLICALALRNKEN